MKSLYFSTVSTLDFVLTPIFLPMTVVNKAVVELNDTNNRTSKAQAAVLVQRITCLANMTMRYTMFGKH